MRLLEKTMVVTISLLEEIMQDQAWMQKVNLYNQPYDAQELISQYQEELEIKMVPFQEMVFAKNKKTYLPLDKIKEVNK